MHPTTKNPGIDALVDSIGDFFSENRALSEEAGVVPFTHFELAQALRSRSIRYEIAALIADQRRKAGIMAALSRV
jgi:hypothetical protein